MKPKGISRAGNIRENPEDRRARSRKGGTKKRDFRKGSVPIVRVRGLASIHWLKGCGRILLPLLGILLFLELSSYLALTWLVSPSGLERFDDLFLTEPEGFSLLPHPYLGWVTQQYVDERERLLAQMRENDSTIITIVTLGGSTTAGAYPLYLESYLNMRLGDLNTTLKARVFNFGVPGWSSVQSVQNYFLLLKYAHPDVWVFQHNTNDHTLLRKFFSDSVIEYPRTSPAEKTLIKMSRLYKLLKFAYLSFYNKLHYGLDLEPFIFMTEDPPLEARLSSYLTTGGPFAFSPIFFQYDFIKADYLPNYLRPGWDEGFGLSLLAENYQSLIDSTRAQNSVLVLSTQYANHSKVFSPYISTAERTSNQVTINNLIREVSMVRNVTLVDLEREMEQYDSLLVDTVHFNDRGLVLEAEIVGKEVYDALERRYNLSD